MALPRPVGVTPAEIAFLCEMELVTVVPRQKLDGLDLLSGSIPPLRPPTRASVPLWLALLLHRQQRANILPPPWLTQPSLARILEQEIGDPATFSPSAPWPRDNMGADISSPPFLPMSTGDSPEGHLPYHWLELGETLLAACGNEIADSTIISGLLRDLREVRASKLRAGMRGLDGEGIVSLRGVGAMELCGERGFMTSILQGLRTLGSTRETARREREADGNGDAGDIDDDNEDDEGF